MKEAGLTKQERNFLALLRAWMILFLFAMGIFIIAPDWMLDYLTAIGRGIFDWREPAITLGNERFWLVLAIALLACLSYLCFVAQRDFLRNMEYAKAIIVSKFVSTAGFVICLDEADHLAGFDALRGREGQLMVAPLRRGRHRR